MATRHWKFHDFNMRFDHIVKVHDEYQKFPIVYQMTGLVDGSQCSLCGERDNGQWLRKTKNEGSNGSIRYATYNSLDEAMGAAIKWARRKDEEQAA